MTRRKLRIAQFLFTAIGLAALGYYLTVTLQQRHFQQQAEQQFQQQLEARKAKPASPAPKRAVPAPPPVPNPADGAVMGRLTIPRLHLSVMVVQGTTHSDLERAAGHIPGTALPGRPGNIGIAAHRDTLFRPLRFIKPNDAITLSTLAGAYHYRVISTQIVSPNDVRVLYPKAHDTLTLVTCYPFYYIGSAPKRFIVQAARTDAAARRANAG